MSRLVFATVGTDHHPFNRMVEWVSSLHSQPGMPEFFLQSGTSKAPENVPSSPYLSFEEMTQLIDRSDATVCHGGPATIIQIRRSGRLPIVVPRRQAEGEHVDDHQWRFARRLAEHQEILLVEELADLTAALHRLDEDPAAFQLSTSANDEHAATLAEFERHITSLMIAKASRGRR